MANMLGRNADKNIKGRVRRKKALEVIKVELDDIQEVEQQIRGILRGLRKSKSLDERMKMRNQIWQLESKVKELKKIKRANKQEVA